MTFVSSWQFVCICVIGSHTYPSFVTILLFIIHDKNPVKQWHHSKIYLKLLTLLKLNFLHIWMNSSWAIRTLMSLGLLGDNDDQKQRMQKHPFLAAKDPQWSTNSLGADDMISSVDKTAFPLLPIKGKTWCNWTSFLFLVKEIITIIFSGCWRKQPDPTASKSCCSK